VKVEEDAESICLSAEPLIENSGENKTKRDFNTILVMLKCFKNPIRLHFINSRGEVFQKFGADDWLHAVYSSEATGLRVHAGIGLACEHSHDFHTRVHRCIWTWGKDCPKKEQQNLGTLEY
jgi:hypothetical protein